LGWRCGKHRPCRNDDDQKAPDEKLAFQSNLSAHNALERLQHQGLLRNCCRTIETPSESAATERQGYVLDLLTDMELIGDHPPDRRQCGNRACGAMARPLFVAASFYKGFTAQLHLADK
jgi:hypothetical protein